MTWIVMCRVSGGVTGYRESPLKVRGADGEPTVARFETEEAAKAKAAECRGAISRHSLASFHYWVEEA